MGPRYCVPGVHVKVLVGAPSGSRTGWSLRRTGGSEFAPRVRYVLRCRHENVECDGGFQELQRLGQSGLLPKGILCHCYGLRVLEWVNCGVFRAPKRAKTSRGAGFVLHSTRPPAVEGSLDLQCLEFAI